MCVSLQDMVCTREALLAQRALGVLEALLSGQRGYEADLCPSLRPALLQALQRLNMESMGHGFGQEHTTQGKRHNLSKTAICSFVEAMYKHVPVASP